jgi:hypothetical protein
MRYGAAAAATVAAQRKTFPANEICRSSSGFLAGH